MTDKTMTESKMAGKGILFLFHLQTLPWLKSMIVVYDND